MPTQQDWARIRNQQGLIAKVVAERYSAGLIGGLADLQPLQRLIEDKAYEAEDTYELQSIGLCFGEVMVKQLGFRWITVEDELGQDPAIQYGSTSIIAYPLTMISKRVEDGVQVDLQEIYADTARTLLRMRDEVAESRSESTWWTRLLSWWER